MMMTGSPGCLALILSSRSRPEPPGMRMSLTSTWGPSMSSSAAASSAASTSRVLVKLRVGRSSRSSAFSSTKRIDWSSSTIQIGFMQLLVAWLLGQRYQYLEIGPSRDAVALDHAVMLLHKSLRKRQSQACPAIPARHQRVKNAVLDRVRHARSIVNDMQFQCQSIPLLVEDDLTRDAGLEGDARIARGTPLGQRLRRVVDDVERGLDQLLAVATELRDGRVEVALDVQVARKLRQDHRPHAL